MGMYNIEQIAVHIIKSEESNEVLKAIRYFQDINNAPGQLFKTNADSIIDDQDRLDLDDVVISKIDTFFTENQFYAFNTSDDVPFEAKNAAIYEKDDKYILYLPRWRKGGYFIKETQIYTDGYFDQVVQAATEVADLFESVLPGEKVIVTYDSKSETESYEKRPFVILN